MRTVRPHECIDAHERRGLQIETTSLNRSACALERCFIGIGRFGLKRMQIERQRGVPLDDLKRFATRRANKARTQHGMTRHDDCPRATHCIHAQVRKGQAQLRNVEARVAREHAVKEQPLLHRRG